MRNNMITKKLIKFALLFFLIGLTACDNKLNPGFDPDDYEPIVPPEPVRTMDAMASGERVVLSGCFVDGYCSEMDAYRETRKYSISL